MKLLIYSIISCLVQAADLHTLWVANSLLNRQFLNDPSAAFKILYLLDYEVNAENLVTVLTLINQARSLNIKARNPNYPYPTPENSNQISNYRPSTQIGNMALGKSEKQNPNYPYLAPQNSNQVSNYEQSTPILEKQNYQKSPRQQIIYPQPESTTTSFFPQLTDLATSQIYQPIPTTIPKQIQSSFDKLKGRLDQEHTTIKNQVHVKSAPMDSLYSDPNGLTKKYFWKRRQGRRQQLKPPNIEQFIRPYKKYGTENEIFQKLLKTQKLITKPKNQPKLNPKSKAKLRKRPRNDCKRVFQEVISAHPSSLSKVMKLLRGCVVSRKNYVLLKKQIQGRKKKS